MTDDTTDDAVQSLRELGLLAPDERCSVVALSGGVSCDVLRITGERGLDVVIKRALPKLRVAQDWRAPIERNATEVAWLKRVAMIEPAWVPAIHGHDRKRNLFAMEYLPAEQHPVWKAELAAGRATADFAGQVGSALARIHASTAGSDSLAAAFANDQHFHDLRLDPYLHFTAGRHPDLAGRITALADGVARARIALMQGDISPKNILCGPSGPVFLDAETACYGDPSFDVAFCLNHLLLKHVWHPEHSALYTESFRAFVHAYRAGVEWEEPDDIEERTAALLPAMLLARIDGKSPVEYLTDEGDKERVRTAARTMLKATPQRLEDVLAYFAGSR